MYQQLRVDKVLRSGAELADIVILSEFGGANLRLKDVATITREYGHNDSLVRCDGRAALVLSIEMQPGFE